MKAVILAGGEGTRLRPLTSNQPKPMMPVANRPMMEHIVRLLKDHGFDEIVVTVAFMANAIRTYFGDGSEFGELDLAELAAAMRGDLLIDGRNFLDAEKVREAGLAYEGIGRPTHKHREPAPAA